LTKPLERTQAQRLEVVENTITEIDKVVCDMIDRSTDNARAADEDYFALEDRVEALEAVPKKTSVGLSLGIVGAAITVALTALSVLGLSLGIVGAAITVALTALSVLGLALTPLQIALPLLVALGAAAVLNFAVTKGYGWFILLVDIVAIMLFGALLLIMLIPVAILTGIGWLIVPARGLVVKSVKFVADLIGGAVERGKKRAEFANA